MRIDVITIFPEYLAPLELSLPGRAQQSGLLRVEVHDLRSWTHDRHHTVDDTPYGGGAGMVMKPEPWGEALDVVLGAAADPYDPAGDTGDAGETVLVVPTPSGEPFRQAVAHELAGAARLVFACGRYEGIDQRVVDEARTRVRVREVSIGDYVLNGGEVAALVVIESVVRLLPGFMGNPESLADESHGDAGLLEYPVYTKPPVWRGHEVPPVLLTGDHARIAEWRHDQAVRRTAARRPDLLPASATLTVDGEQLAAVAATPADAAELLTLQRACAAEEALASGTLDDPSLTETLADVRSGLDAWRTWVVRSDGRLVASVRARQEGETWQIGRVLVAPDLGGRALESWLLEHAEAAAPEAVTGFSVTTGDRRENLRAYRKAGYRPQGPAERGVVALVKRRR